MVSAHLSLCWPSLCWDPCPVITRASASSLTEARGCALGTDGQQQRVRPKGPGVIPQGQATLRRVRVPLPLPQPHWSGGQLDPSEHHARIEVRFPAELRHVETSAREQGPRHPHVWFSQRLSTPQVVGPDHGPAHYPHSAGELSVVNTLPKAAPLVNSHAGTES